MDTMLLFINFPGTQNLVLIKACLGHIQIISTESLNFPNVLPSLLIYD